MITLLGLLAAGVLPVFSQEGGTVPRAARPRVAAPSAMPVPVVPMAPGQPQPNTARMLDENCRIVLRGDMGETRKIDLALTGAGPQFLANVVSGEPGEELSVEFTVTPVAADGVMVNYSIVARVKHKDGNQTTYQDFPLRGSVRCKTGKPVEIFRSHNTFLTLVVEDPTADKPKLGA